MKHSFLMGILSRLPRELLEETDLESKITEFIEFEYGCGVEPTSEYDHESVEALMLYLNKEYMAQA